MSKSPSKTPLKRIYFDSNILHGWPNATNELWSVLNSAGWLRAGLHFPQVVEDELEAQFVRGIQKSYDDVEAAFKQLAKRSRTIMVPEFSGKAASEAELRAAFQVRSKELKSHFGIATIPITKVDLKVLVDMAINRVAPFEEIVIAKDKKAVVGLQDAVILFSIIEHMKDSKDERCAIVTNDAIFYHKDTRDFLKQVGVELEGFRSLTALWNDLFDCILPFIRDPWMAEMDQIEIDLNAAKTDLTKQILGFLNTSELGENLNKRAKEIRSFQVTEFSMVKTDLPDINLRPPSVAAYTREDGSSLKISAQARTEMDAIVERMNWWSLIGSPPPDPGAVPVLEETTLKESFNVSILGKVRNGAIGDFEVTAVEPWKSQN